MPLRTDISLETPGVSNNQNQYADNLETDVLIVGGGASRRAGKWLPLIDVETEVVPAALTNEAGIVGAALVGAMDHPLT